MSPVAALLLIPVIIAIILGTIPVGFGSAALSQFDECHSHSLIPNTLTSLLTTVTLAHFFFSMSRMYIVSVVTPPIPNPPAKAARINPIVSMSGVYQVGSVNATPA